MTKLLIFVILFFLPGCDDQRLNFIEANKVTVIDGDTLLLNNKTWIRLSGLDAPELGQEPFGIEARDRLEALIKSDLPLICFLTGKDTYFRFLAECVTNSHKGLNVNSWLVVEGLALVNPHYPSSYKYEQTIARQLHLGVWNLTTKNPLQEAPWEFRKRLRFINN